MPDVSGFTSSTRRGRLVSAFTVALLASVGCHDFDTVLEGGRVIDPESGLDALRNVGIRDGRITVISQEPLDGARTIDASGLVVAPGFVDLHRHGQSEDGYRLQVHDGVTTGLELEIGTADVGDWYAAREGGQLVNYGVAQGHIGARARAMGDSVTGTGGVTHRESATLEEIAETERLIREGLAEGAVGIGFGSAYTPGAPMTEIERMFGIAAEHDVVAFIHLRGGLEGLDSTLTAAREAGAALHVVHANSSGGSDIVEFLAMIDSAQDAGQDVTTEAYPYAASQTGIQSALFDDWETWDDGQFQIYQWVRTGERLDRERFRAYREEGGSVIIHSRTEEMTLLAITNPITMIASDGGTGHPRGAGTFAKVLGRYVRDQGVLDLTDALARMTIRPAQRLEPFVPAMRNKGRIRVGADADVTVFDPDRVIDRATYLDGSLTSVGFEFVLVNGVVVIDAGELVEDVRPGRAIKAGPG